MSTHSDCNTNKAAEATYTDNIINKEKRAVNSQPSEIILYVIIDFLL